MTNVKGEYLFGVEQFLPSRVGILTKSYKDVFLLRQFRIDGVQIGAVALTAESNIMSNKYWNNIRHHSYPG